MRQEIIRNQRKEIIKRVQTLATMDTSELDKMTQYESIEDAYKNLKQEFDDALALRQVDPLYLTYFYFLFFFFYMYLF